MTNQQVSVLTLPPPWWQPQPIPLDQGITNPALKETIQKMSGLEFLQIIINNIIILFLVAGVIVALILIIIGGIQWMTASGDKAKMEGARGIIVGALVGLVIILAVYAIIRLIGDFLGIELLSLPVPIIGE
jgi:heme/copper-type cytochrome/quinol oxidase subunit 2